MICRTATDDAFVEYMVFTIIDMKDTVMVYLLGNFSKSFPCI